MEIRLLDGAIEDLRNGWFFYERQSPGLGDRFLDAMEAEVQTLTLHAGIHLIDDDTIAIYAILDCRRDPNGLRKRLGGSDDLTWEHQWGRTVQNRRGRNRWIFGRQGHPSAGC